MPHLSAVLTTRPSPLDQTFLMQQTNVLNSHPTPLSFTGKLPDILFTTYSIPKTMLYFIPKKEKEWKVMDITWLDILIQTMPEI